MGLGGGVIIVVGVSDDFGVIIVVSTGIWIVEGSFFVAGLIIVEGEFCSIGVGISLIIVVGAKFIIVV